MRMRGRATGTAAAAGLLSVVALLGLACVGLRLQGQRDALVALPVGKSLVKETYAEDVAAGEKIIAKMAHRVHNPMWQQLMGSPKMRSALAAAIGAERLQPGGSGAAAAAASFNLGNLLSGMPHPKRKLVQQQLRLATAPHPHLYDEFVSPRREWERAEGRSRRGTRARRGTARRERAARPHVAPSWEPEMPDRLAANGWQQALSPVGRATSQALHSAPPSQVPHAVSHTNFVFDEFAPGVLPGTSTVPAAAPKAAAAPTPAASAKLAKKTATSTTTTTRASVKQGIEKATGFGDTIVKVGETPEAKLKKEVEHLRAVNAQEKTQFEKREQVDIEHKLVALEKQQLASPHATSPAGAQHKGAAAAAAAAAAAQKSAVGLSSSAEDVRVGKLLKKDKSSGKKVLGMLKAAEVERRAQAIAAGQIPGHLSKGFQTPAAKRRRLEEEERRQAHELETEVERHAAIIAGATSPSPPPPVRRAAAAERHGRAWGDGYVHHKGYVQGGWRALAEKSKALARSAGAGSAPTDGSARTAAARASASTAARPQLAPATSAHAAAHMRARGLGSVGAGGGESWETEIRADSLPIVCGLPLLAEASGIDCHSVKRVHKLNGHNRIRRDLKEVGLGDDEIGTGDRRPTSAGPFKPGGALGVPHKAWGQQLAPTRPFGSGSAIQALGFASPAQYEKHTLLSTIAKEEDTIERLRTQLAAKNGGIKAAKNGSMNPPLSELSSRLSGRTGQGARGSAAHGRRAHLEDAVVREQKEMDALEAELHHTTMHARSLSGQSLAAALVQDVRGSSAKRGVLATSDVSSAAASASAYSPKSDTKYMGDRMVSTSGRGGIGLELAGAVPNGLEIDT